MHLTLEGLIRSVWPHTQFRLSIIHKGDDGIHVIIHADGKDSDTLDYLVQGDKLIPCDGNGNPLFEA